MHVFKNFNYYQKVENIFQIRNCKTELKPALRQLRICKSFTDMAFRIKIEIWGNL